MTATTPRVEPDLVRLLREDLRTTGFTVDGVTRLIGPMAAAALDREQALPAQRATAASDDPVASLVRLFTLGDPVDATEVAAALPSLGVAGAAALGLLAPEGDALVATCDLRPYAADGTDWWVASDLGELATGAPLRPDHVLGVGGASTTLASWTPRPQVRRALDLGTGCGVQALHLAGHADEVVATDVNARALWMTRLNAALNEVDVDVRDGSFFEPVAGERFDLIATNPPFVISPATGERLVYRDSGLPGDRVVEHIVRTGPEHLTEGGWLQVLANWAIHRDQPWEERLGGWLRPDCDALVVQRETLDPAAYVELWLKDSGHHGGPDYAERYDTWLSWLDEQGIAGVGFGWIDVRLGGTGRHDLLEWPYDVEQPIGPAIHAWGDAVSGLARLGDDDLLAQRLVVRPDVQQETVGQPGAEDPETIVLRQQRGFRRARTADTVEAGLVGACDGDLSVGQLLDALATLLERDADELRATYLPVVRELVEQGFLLVG